MLEGWDDKPPSWNEGTFDSKTWSRQNSVSEQGFHEGRRSSGGSRSKFGSSHGIHPLRSNPVRTATSTSGTFHTSHSTPEEG